MQDCYFVVSPEQTICAICLDCNKNSDGFYWEGSKLGYGVNKDVKCSVCNKTIHKESDDDQDDIQNQN